MAPDLEVLLSFPFPMPFSQRWFISIISMAIEQPDPKHGLFHQLARVVLYIKKVNNTFF
jgi:hypothetical protein